MATIRTHKPLIAPPASRFNPNPKSPLFPTPTFTFLSRRQKQPKAVFSTNHYSVSLSPLKPQPLIRPIVKPLIREIPNFSRASAPPTESTHRPISALALSLSSGIIHLLLKSSVQNWAPNIQVSTAAGPLFFAAVGLPDTPSGPLVTALAMGLAKLLDLFSGILTVRILLTWFPNIPWERQPFSAVRDLCDPYLSLFRKVVPPIGNVDCSSVLGFLVLGMLGSILNVKKVV